jgi:hypothetical protein
MAFAIPSMAQEPCDDLSISVTSGCFPNGGSGWAALEEITGAAYPVTIEWSTGQEVQFITGLNNGEYSVTVTDANDCVVQEFVTISCAAVCDVEVTVDYGCTGGEGQGWATVESVTGTTGSYNTLWSTGETGSMISGLESGEYWVWVSDELNCWDKTYFTIECAPEDCEVAFDLDWGCNGTTSGWASIGEPTGVTYPITIQWSTGATNTQFITDLPNGEYWVMVTDGEGCWFKEDFSVICTQDPDCELDAELTYGCMGDGTGWAAVLTVTGATHPTTILWSTGDEVQFVPNLEPGDYWVMVMDAEGCWEKEYFTIDCDSDCDVMVTVDSGCETEGDGWASIALVTGATGSYAILWSTGETTEMITGLSSGSYWVMVTDEGGCWDKDYFTIECGSEPCQLRTQTMGGWGAPANGNNPGMYRDMHFDTAFPDGLTIGCTNTLTLTSAAAVEDFLPSGGQPSMLSSSMTDPGNYNNVLAGQLVALTLSVGFDAYDPDFGMSMSLLADATLNNGMFEGWTVQELLDEANSFIGGCGSTYTASQLSDALAMVNENFVGGDTNNGNIDCSILPKNLTDGSMAMKAFPIPVVDMLNVEISAMEDGMYDLILMDATGRILLSQRNEAFEAGVPRTITLDVDGLVTGSYMLAVFRDDAVQRTERIIITR